jgi:hypothetical protein
MGIQEHHQHCLGMRKEELVLSIGWRGLAQA